MYAVVVRVPSDERVRRRRISARSLGWSAMTPQPTMPDSDEVVDAVSALETPESAPVEVDLATETQEERLARFERDALPLLDQLYGYSPAMNALLAMSKGKIVVGGAAPAHVEYGQGLGLAGLVGVLVVGAIVLGLTRVLRRA